jgi:vacuolar protein sorting-associated protein 13A/C
VMPSMDFKRVWQSARTSAAAAGGPSGLAGRSGARDTRLLSIWRPVGPPGYSSLGDVAVSGSEPPSGRPVRMYKDVVGAGDAPGQVRL